MLIGFLLILLSFFIFIESIHHSQVKRPSKEVKHHFDDCHILIQYYLSVSESELLFTPNLKSISVKIAFYSKISLFFLEPKYNGLVYSTIYFSDIGMEFGLDDNLHLVSFLSQQYTMFQYH